MGGEFVEGPRSLLLRRGSSIAAQQVDQRRDRPGIPNRDLGQLIVVGQPREGRSGTLLCRGAAVLSAL